MKNDTRIQFVVSNTQPKEPGFQGGLAVGGLPAGPPRPPPPAETNPQVPPHPNGPRPPRPPGQPGLFRCPSDNNFSFPFLKTMKVLATFSYLYYDRTIEFTKNPIKIGPADQLLIYHAIKT